MGHFWNKSDGKLTAGLALAIALFCILLVFLYAYLGIGQTNGGAVGPMASTPSRTDSNQPAPEAGSERLRSVEDSKVVEREAVPPTASEGMAPPHQAEPVASKAREAIEAEAEIGRLSRSYAHFCREFDRDSPEVTIYARTLVSRCIAVELSAQGRGEAWQPADGDMGSWPKISPEEEQFLVGPKLYRITKSEFPIFLKLDEWKAYRDPGANKDGEVGVQANLTSMNAEVRAEIEAQFDATLAYLSKIANPK